MRKREDEGREVRGEEEEAAAWEETETEEEMAGHREENKEG